MLEVDLDREYFIRIFIVQEIFGQLLLFLNSQIFTQQEWPGNLQCQNTHPSTGLRVMETAAAEGDKNLLPFKTKAPPKTLP